MTTIIAIAAGFLFICLYWFIILPQQVKKHIKLKYDYREELQNLHECINKADTLLTLNMCWHAVVEWHIRNKYLKGKNVTKEAKKMYAIIRIKMKYAKSECPQINNQ